MADPFAVLNQPQPATPGVDAPNPMAGIKSNQPVQASAPAGGAPTASMASDPKVIPLTIVAISMVRRVLAGMADDVSFQIGRKMISAVAPAIATALGDRFDPQTVKRIAAVSFQALTEMAERHKAASGPPAAPMGGSPTGPAGVPAPPVARAPVMARPPVGRPGSSLAALGGGRG